LLEGRGFKLKVVLILFKNSVLTSKKIEAISITKLTWLMLFTETIFVYTKNHITATDAHCGQNAELLIAIAGVL
jgi:hypothetical protein